MSTTIEQVAQTLARLAPLGLAEDWDNVGLLVGDRRQPVARVMTCLTITPAVIAEAIEQEVGLIVTHHPLPFKPLRRLTGDSLAGELLLQLAAAGVAVYSAHTAYDSAIAGINQQWANGLGLRQPRPLEPCDPEEDLALGAGRLGRLPEPSTLVLLGQQAADFSRAAHVRYVGDPDQAIQKVAIACGSGGGLLASAIGQGCDAMITGEATFHTCLEAESRGLGLVLLGHYASERFAMESLVDDLLAEHPAVQIWASRQEADPIRSLPPAAG